MSKTQSSSPNTLLDEDEEYLLDEVKGMRLKKKLAVLNKGKVTKEDMDKLFLPEDFND